MCRVWLTISQRRDSCATLHCRARNHQTVGLDHKSTAFFEERGNTLLQPQRSIEVINNSRGCPVEMRNTPISLKFRFHIYAEKFVFIEMERVIKFQTIRPHNERYYKTNKQFNKSEIIPYCFWAWLFIETKSDLNI